MTPCPSFMRQDLSADATVAVPAAAAAVGQKVKQHSIYAFASRLTSIRHCGHSVSRNKCLSMDFVWPVFSRKT